MPDLLSHNHTQILPLLQKLSFFPKSTFPISSRGLKKYTKTDTLITINLLIMMIHLKKEEVGKIN